ncbi:hypothetical protein NADFUDRAFT_81593 [Nadsonia fulvescens var. elongata DSM 6958]|uniref:L domain-like protein n=1 Tax=Nadsonia fulvescens var. elongata DSM 6958 TaxID=857566 RepID=A0A1E3PQ33_9ASCO|nr:hypothetical protein NADFUDRAFT_81593 [Nadsonia fulvescens var. elongata DSM 6958]
MSEHENKPEFPNYFPRPLLPFSHDQSRGFDEIILSTEPRAQVLGRKRNFDMTSDTLSDIGAIDSSTFSEYDTPSAKRAFNHNHPQITSDAEEVWTQELPDSSPPLNPRDFSSFECDFLVRNKDAGDEDNTLTDLVLPTATRMSSHNEADRLAVVRIRRAVEEGISKISLDSLDLDVIPDEVADLKDFISIPVDNIPFSNDVQLFLVDNHITELPCSLFEVVNLTVLSLRKNKISEIPPAIGKLQNLIELSLSNNQLEYLPSQILKLKNLRNFSVYPNRFLPLPLEANRDHLAESTDSKAVCIYRQSFITKNRNNSKEIIIAAPPLTEFCLNTVSRFHISERERRKWALPSNIQKMVDDSRMAYKYANSCGVCDRQLSVGIGYAYEWWEGLWGNSVTIKRFFCSTNCYQEWHNNLLLR